MAEVAAGLWAAEEVVSTGVQAGVGAYYVGKDTMPLRATFTQIAHASDESTRSAVARLGHTVSVVKHKAFIFGGETAFGKLASNEVYSVTLPSAESPEVAYDSIPAASFAEEGGVPTARKHHAACTLNERIAVFGGIDGSDEPINERAKVWLFDTGKLKWEDFETTEPDVFPKSRSKAQLFMAGDPNYAVLYGGIDASGTELKDVWHFDLLLKKWSELPEAPVWSPHAAFSDGVLYIVSETDSIGGDVHSLPLPTSSSEQEPSWSTVNFPNNPLTPGPSARKAAGLLPITTGYGRHFLAYLFGQQAYHGSHSMLTGNTQSSEKNEQTGNAAPEYCSDIWTYQLPSSTPRVEVTTNFTEAIKPAKIKDKIRGALGLDDGKHSWAEVTVVPPTELPESEGKLHPGPRASFACDVMGDGQSAVLWGGINPKGEIESDGWIIKLE